ncbi:unnamed protein product [Candidula unifasciata]|uniref:Major royal jelly protein n=1 Tax=Candidula unifasciata TaxID=100452 RepID=A0A8S3Z3I8_9EUPU|nr:unnamed protein product [Candidula unifasciata]
METLDLMLLVVVTVVLAGTNAAKFGEAQLVFDWEILELDWPSEADKLEAIRNGSYVPERNLLAGIKVYKNNVYLTIPRWTWTSGHPITLAKVVSVQGQSKLCPYPNWTAQKQGDCHALQYVQSMEVDPNTGLMYVLDSGRVGGSLNLCPAKIVVFDLNTDTQVHSYQMPEDVVTRTHNAMNDIVLDYVAGKVRYAYISDVSEGRIHVYDFQTHSAHNLEHPSMKAEGNNGTVIHINNKDYVFGGAVDGIAISPDFKYVYYCPLGGYSLYEVPTSVLRNPNNSGTAGPRLVGRKVSQSDGLAHGSNHLFYGALGLNAVYFWDAEKDMADQNVGIENVKLATQVELVRNDTTMVWPDTFAFDDQGYLWFVANSLNTFRNPGGNPLNRVWKVFVNETGYLYEADKRTLGTVVG